MATEALTKEKIIHILDQLPPESLGEVQQLLDFLRFKNRQQVLEDPVALAGLLEGYHFSEEEIAKGQHEMWRRLNEDVI